MPIVATSARRQIAMAVMIGLAVTGGLMRHYAANPSMLRDVGSLLLVMWLPAVGNLVAWLVRKLPRGAPPPTGFPEGSAVAPQLRVQLASVPLPSGLLEGIDPSVQMATFLVGRQGFTVRAAVPVAQWLRTMNTQIDTQMDAQTIDFEFLRPVPALKALPPGTAFHVLLGTTAVARGQVVSVIAR